MHQIKDYSGKAAPSSVVLASSSSRRRELLGQIGVSASVAPANINERTHPGELPKDYVERLARQKATAVAETAVGELVIGADTTISHDESILGKPENRSHAIEILSALSGCEHHVYTGVAVAVDQEVESVVVATRVEFLSMTSQDIENYVDTEEPFGKAGAYAIQGLGALWVKKIDGSYSNVVGLPLAETAILMKRFGYCVLSHRRADRSGN